MGAWLGEGPGKGVEEAQAEREHKKNERNTDWQHGGRAKLATGQGKGQGNEQFEK